MKMKKVMAVALSAAMCACLLPAAAFASEDSYQAEVINLANERDPTDLSPWAGNMGGASALIPMVYQTLFICEYGQDEEPCLAKERTQVDDEGYVWDVELFDYIYDSEGNHMTADDVKFSVDTCKEIGKSTAMATVEGVEVTGDYTFRVTFTDEARMGDFEAFFHMFMIVTQAAYEASPDAMVTTPVGSAQYTLGEYISGSLISFEARDNYWQTDEQYIARSSQANVKEINFWLITEAAQRSNGIQEGSIDYGAISSTDKDTIESLDGYYITEVPDNLTWMLFANVSDSAATSDQLVREAIFYAIDGEGVATSFTNSNGNAVPVYDISNSNYDDYYEDIYKEEAETNYYSYNPDKALELLEEAGYPNGEGLKIRLICSSEQAATDTATIIEAYLMQVGITLETNAYQSSLMSEYAEDPDGWDLYLLQYASTDYAVNVWEKVLNKAKYSWGGTINFVMSDELQDMLSEVRTASGHTEENVIAFHDYIIDNAYALGLMQQINYYGTSNKIEEVVFSDQYIIRPNACTYAME